MALNQDPPKLKAPPGTCDTHMHIYESGFPTAPSATFTPPDAPVADYLKVRARLGITRTVVVQPSTYGTDNRCTLAAIAALGDSARGIAVVDQSVTDAELERLVEIGGPARDAVRLGELLQPVGAAPDQDRVGHHPVAVLERHAALITDGADRTDQVLVHAHASGDAVHDDAEPLLRHECSSRDGPWFSTTAPPLDGRPAA